MNSFRSGRLPAIILSNLPIALSLLSSTASANQLTDQLTDLNSPPLSHWELDLQRGGFFSVKGLNIKIGLEKIVLFDGELVTKTKFTLPNIDAKSPAQATIAASNQKLAQTKQLLSGIKTAIKKAQQPQLDPKALTAITKAIDTPNPANGNDTSIQLTANTQPGNTLAPSKLSMADISQGSSSQLPNQEAVATTAPTMPATNNPVTTANPSTPSPLPTNPNSVADQNTPDVAAVADPLDIAFSSPDALTLVRSTTATGGLNTVIQNSADSRLIQTVDVMNIEMSDISRSSHRGLNALLLPQLIHSSR